MVVRQNPSKRVPIFDRGTEANLKMVPIWLVPIPRNHTVVRKRGEREKGSHVKEVTRDMKKCRASKVEHADR